MDCCWLTWGRRRGWELELLYLPVDCLSVDCLLVGYRRLIGRLRIVAGRIGLAGAGIARIVEFYRFNIFHVHRNLALRPRVPPHQNRECSF